MLATHGTGSVTMVVEEAATAAAELSVAQILVNLDVSNRSDAHLLANTIRDLLDQAIREGRDLSEIIKNVLLVAFKRRNHLKSQVDGDGAGEKSILLEVLIALLVIGDYNDLIAAVLPLLPLYGSWRDLRLLAEEIILRNIAVFGEAKDHPIVELICQLFADQMAADTANADGTPSNACKYAPHSHRSDKRGSKRPRDAENMVDEGAMDVVAETHVIVGLDDDVAMPPPAPVAERGTGRGRGRGGRGFVRAAGRGGRGGRGRGDRGLSAPPAAPVRTESATSTSAERHAANQRLSHLIQSRLVPDEEARSHGDAAYRKIRAALNARLTASGHLIEPLLANKKIGEIDFVKANKGSLTKYTAGIKKDATAAAKWKEAIKKSGGKAVPDLDSLREAITSCTKEIEEQKDAAEPFYLFPSRAKKAVESLKKARQTLVGKAKKLLKQQESTIEVAETRESEWKDVPAVIVVDTADCGQLGNESFEQRARLVLAGLLMTLSQPFPRPFIVIDGQLLQFPSSVEEVFSENGNWLSQFVPTETAIAGDSIPRLQRAIQLALDQYHGDDIDHTQQVDVTFVCLQFTAYDNDKEAAVAVIEQAQQTHNLRTFRLHRVKAGVSGDDSNEHSVEYRPRTGLVELPQNPSELTADLLFVLDCTGSMGAYIAAVKQELKTVITEIHESIRMRHVRIAFIGYRDFSDTGRVVRVDFHDQAELQHLLDAIANEGASGGADEPEDMLSAFTTAATLRWESMIRLMVIIADAPAHGYCLAGPYNHDNYPSGLCPDQTVAIPEAMHTLAETNRIDTLFCQLTTRTTVTQNVIMNAYAEHGNAGFGTISMLNGGATNFRDKIVSAISQAVLKSLAVEDVKGLQTADGITVSSLQSSLNASIRESCNALGLTKMEAVMEKEKTEKTAETDWNRLERELEGESLTLVRMALRMPVLSSMKLSYAAAEALYKAGLSVEQLTELSYPSQIVDVYREYLAARLSRL